MGMIPKRLVLAGVWLAGVGAWGQQVAAPMVQTVGEAEPAAHVNDVVHPAKHPDETLLGPAQMRHFYNLDGVTNQGEGQTIALIGGHHDPTLDFDLAVFSARFGLPQCSMKTGCLRQIATLAPGGPASWKPNAAAGAVSEEPHQYSYLEESMDVEWAHAIAPKAHLMLVETPVTGFEGYVLAVDAAVENGATVVSLSLAEPERADHKDKYLRLDAHFNDTRASYVASGGDHAHTARWPASNANVVGVGGTVIKTNAAGDRLEEVAWSRHSSEEHASGTGGGLSLAEPEPAYQIAFGLPGDEAHMRGTPDVSYFAFGKDGCAVYDSNANPKTGASGWRFGAGTSAGAPQWAGLIAVANSMRAAKGKSSLAKYVGKDGQKGTVAAIYAVAKSTPDAFFDITSGTNGDCGAECTAGKGYDYLTGVGSPNGAVLLEALTALP